MIAPLVSRSVVPTRVRAIRIDHVEKALTDSGTHAGAGDPFVDSGCPGHQMWHPRVRRRSDIRLNMITSAAFIGRRCTPASKSNHTRLPLMTFSLCVMVLWVPCAFRARRHFLTKGNRI